MGANEKMLDERALRLAARRSSGSDGANASQTAAETGDPVLVFKLGAERFALRMNLIRTILPYAKVTPVALTPPEVLGVTAHKGEVHSVYELSRLLELAPSGIATDQGRIVILRAEKHSPGVRVDQIESIDFLDVVAGSPSALSTTSHSALGTTSHVALSTTSRSYVKPRHSEALILIENLEILSRGDASLDGE